MEKSAGVAVTISRQTGSGGTYVGYLAAKMLGFRYVDREILQKAAQEMGTDVRELELQDERSSGLIETILKGFAIGAPFSGMMRHARPVYDRDLFASERKIVQDIAGKYNAVFIGRAAFHMLRDHPRVFRVFVYAPQEFRIDRVMKAQKISMSQAESFILESDRRRAKYIRDMAGVDWLDVRNHHLCIDTSRIEFELGAEMIAGAVRQKWPQGATPKDKK
ncbi:MAG: cytidylate kinase-like family protein [Syntrophobacterales bacterium]|nr:cytidylate kinase-like family protein [Syntrophobacterales bacterium]